MRIFMLVYHGSFLVTHHVMLHLDMCQPSSHYGNNNRGKTLESTSDYIHRINYYQFYTKVGREQQ